LAQAFGSSFRLPDSRFMMPGAMHNPGEIYLERQRRMCCGVHTVNNLLQLRPGDAAHFEKADADAIASQLLAADDEAAAAVPTSGSLLAQLANILAVWLPCRNPYRSGIPCCGDYDVEVLREALRQRGCSVVGHWAVSQEGALGPVEKGLAQLVLSPTTDGPLVGLVVNRPSQLGIGRHWYCLLHADARASSAPPPPRPPPPPPPPPPPAAPAALAPAWYCLDSNCHKAVPVLGAGQPARVQADATSDVEAVIRHIIQQLRKQWCCGVLTGGAQPVHIFAVCGHR